MFRIIGIGDNVVDRYLYKNKMYPGGNAVNVPVLAKRTGMASAAYVGCVGTDKAGQTVLSALQSEGLDTSFVTVLEGENAYADVTLVEGDRVFIGGSAGVSHNIKLTPEIKNFAAQYQLIHTSIYSGLDDVLDELHKIGPAVAYDYSDCIDFEKVKPTLPYVDFAIFSGGDAPLEELQAFMQKVVAFSKKDVLVTMGSRGAMLLKDGKFYQQGIYRLEKVVDTMGAGDSFIARYLTGVYNNETIEQSLQNAAEYAAKNCLVDGTFGYETEI